MVLSIRIETREVVRRRGWVNIAPQSWSADWEKGSKLGPIFGVAFGIDFGDFLLFLFGLVKMVVLRRDISPGGLQNGSKKGPQKHM